MTVKDFLEILIDNYNRPEKNPNCFSKDTIRFRLRNSNNSPFLTKNQAIVNVKEEQKFTLSVFDDNIYVNKKTERVDIYDINMDFELFMNELSPYMRDRINKSFSRTIKINDFLN